MFLLFPDGDDSEISIQGNNSPFGQNKNTILNLQSE
jgi:hypothetical protein